MRKIKQLKGWGIYELSEKEKLDFGFNFAVIHPDTMGAGLLTPKDTDMELEMLDHCINWICNY